ncbi:MAG: Uma2 family endonuclease [Cyanobacteria bacterium P01_F01_bin.53]
MVANSIRWTVQDLEGMPDDWGWKRYEIIDGELIVTRAPHIWHQNAGGNIRFELTKWSRQTQLGKAFDAPGVIFTESDAVIPDVVWASNQRLTNGIDEAGHFVVAPELMVEVLSAGPKNEQRDRRSKLKLYSLHGVQEYWIANWRLKTIEVYRRQEAQLQLAATLVEGDRLSSPLLPGFDCAIADIFQ